MRNLRDYLKLIFAAVVCFVMSFIPGKKSVKEVAVNVNGKGNVKDEKVTHGSEETVTFIKKVKYRMEKYNSVIRRNIYSWKVYWHMPYIKKEISSFGYYNTG